MNFYKLIKKSNLYISKPIKYVCGHSLGGIISKMIAPLTKVDVCAFNSPGVIEFLEHLNWPIDILENQKIVTYVANRDEVGELKSYAELGERIYLATSHKNQTRVIVPDIHGLKYEDIFPNEAAASLGSQNALSNRMPMPFHSMSTLYKYLYDNNFENIFLKKNMNYKLNYKNYLDFKLKRKDVLLKIQKNRYCQNPKFRYRSICK